MGKINSYTAVFGLSLSLSGVFGLAGKVALSNGLFTMLAAGSGAAGILMFLLSRKHERNIMDGELIRAGAIMGLTAGAIGLGCQLSALKFVSPIWVMGLIFCAPVLSAIMGREETKGVWLAGIMAGYMSMVVMTSGSEVTDRQIFGLFLSGLGTVSLAVGLAFHRKERCRWSSSGLAFWAALTAFIFLIPASLGEPVRLKDWGLAQAASSAGLGLMLLSSMACLIWLTNHGKSMEADPLIFPVAPVLSLLILFIVFEAGINIKEAAGMVVVGLALGLSQAGEKRKATNLSLSSIKLENENQFPFDKSEAA